MHTAASSKIVLLVSAFFIAMLLMASLISPANMLEVSSQDKLSNNQNSEKQDTLETNSAYAAKLTAQIMELKNEIAELRLTVNEKTAENSKLKKQALDLSKAIRDIESQLESLQKSEQLYQFVDRLRNPINQTGDDP